MTSTERLELVDRCIVALASACVSDCMDARNLQIKGHLEEIIEIARGRVDTYEQFCDNSGIDPATKQWVRFQILEDAK